MEKQPAKDEDKEEAMEVAATSTEPAEKKESDAGTKQTKTKMSKKKLLSLQKQRERVNT